MATHTIAQNNGSAEYGTQEAAQVKWLSVPWKTAIIAALEVLALIMLLALLFGMR